jgi:hypothetical protein
MARNILLRKLLFSEALLLATEPGFGEAVEMKAGWQVPHGLKAYFREALHTGDDQEIYRNQVSHRKGDQGQVEESSSPAGDIARPASQSG